MTLMRYLKKERRGREAGKERKTLLNKRGLH